MPLASPSTLRNYAELTKPRLLPLVLLTGLPALYMAAGGPPVAGLRRARAARHRARRGLGQHAERVHRARQGRADGAHQGPPAAGGPHRPARRRSRFGLVLAVASTAAALRDRGPGGGGPRRREHRLLRLRLHDLAEAALGVERRDRRRRRRGGAADRRRRGERPRRRRRASRSSRSSSSGSRPTSGRSRCTARPTTRRRASRCRRA